VVSYEPAHAPLGSTNMGIVFAEKHKHFEDSGRRCPRWE
jgi:hypothetical protein